MTLEHPTREASFPVHHPSSGSRSLGGRLLRLLIWMLLIAAVLGGGYYAYHHYAAPGPAQRPAGRAGMGGPVPVMVAPAVKGDMPVTLSGLGTVTPLATVVVKTQIAGQLQQLGFNEGQLVKAGDFLAEIDPRPYQNALQQAQGQLLRDQALLANARVDLARYRTLLAQDSIAQQQLATQDALVHQYEGTVETDQGQVATAKLNLAYCHIVSPITGRVGLRQVDIGNYVQTSDTNGIVLITQLQPITVLFTLPEDNLPALLPKLRGGVTMPVVALDRSQTNVLATGTLATIDNTIDTSTGTVKIKANFTNQDEALFPNQFVNVRVTLDVLHDATIIPVAGVQRGAPGTFVYLLKPAENGGDPSVSVRPVTLGPGDGTNIVITKGLALGDQVVVDGADKLRDGAKVLIPNPAAAGAGSSSEGQGHHHHHEHAPAGNPG